MSSRPFKVCLLGEGRVGKTSILLRYIKNTFDDRQASTLTACMFDKTVPLGGGESVRVSIWDTAGQERFHALGPLYYRDADGALLVYDITDDASFTRVKDWVKELRKMLGDDITIAIAGNKMDMEKSRAVDRDEAVRYAAEQNAVHFLTSAKSGAGISEAFTELLKRIVAKKRGGGGAPSLGGAAAAAAGPASTGPARASSRLRVEEDDDGARKREGGGCAC